MRATRTLIKPKSSRIKLKSIQIKSKSSQIQPKSNQNHIKIHPISNQNQIKIKVKVKSKSNPCRNPNTNHENERNPGKSWESPSLARSARSLPGSTRLCRSGGSLACLRRASGRGQRSGAPGPPLGGPARGPRRARKRPIKP